VSLTLGTGLAEQGIDAWICREVAVIADNVEVLHRAAGSPASLRWPLLFHQLDDPYLFPKSLLQSVEMLDSAFYASTIHQLNRLVIGAKASHVVTHV
jgi:hypothetical protein